jgi:hypothetical protein
LLASFSCFFKRMDSNSSIGVNNWPPTRKVGRGF